MTRYATVAGNGLTREKLERYLPSNYIVLAKVDSVGWLDSPGYLIAGEDDAGWTLDGYVIPRLGSGLYGAREVDESELDDLTGRMA